MTDKQIIIDGVNISELTSDQLACMNRYDVARLFIKLVEALSRTEDDYNVAQEDRVKMWTYNTELKTQLDQLKAENEELKNFHINLVGVKECEIRELAEIKYENKMLNLTISSLEETRDLFADKIDQLKDELEDYIIETEEDKKIIAELKQTLAEIKEIVEANKKYIYVLPNYSVAGDSLEFSFEFTKQILQKISEVADGNK